MRKLLQPFQYKQPTIIVETKTKQKLKPRMDTVKRIWGYLAQSRGSLMFVLCLVILSSCFALTGPLLVGKVIDQYIILRKVTGLQWLLLALVALYVLYSLFLWLQNVIMVRIAQETVFSMRQQLFGQLQVLPVSFFDKRQHGELMSRVTNDIDNVSTTLNDSFIQVFSSIFTLLAIVSVMLWLSPILTVTTLCIVPLMLLGMKWITRRTSYFFKQQQRNLGEINGFIEEITSGQKIIKAFSQEQRVMEEFVAKSEKLKMAGYWAQAYSGFIPKLMNVLNNAGFALIATVGGVLAYQDMVTVGTVLIFIEYARQFTRPLNDLSNQFNTLLSALAGAERVFEVIDESKETDEGTTTLSSVEGDVVFCDVSFSYEEGQRTVQNIHFHARPGETIAFVGATGAGKTTIINLLARFYDPDEGEILLDGHPITNIARDHLRAQMGFVLQDSFLFQGTIRENIRYGRLDATDEEVEEAAKQANAYSFIAKLPEGFDTILTQDGAGISQGEKQLLAIARAIVMNPRILILDEATSSIDTITELKIQEALQHLMEGRTSFVVAHRLNTIRRADQILVMNDGMIVERGSHHELVQGNGTYAELYHGQFREEQ